MKRACAIAALTLVMTAAPAFARPPAYAYKAGAEPDAMGQDEATCWNDAMKAMNDPKFQNPWLINPATQGTAAGAMGSAIGQGLAQGIEGGKRFKLTFYDCLNAKGYTLRRPSEVEWKAMKKLGKEERAAQMRRWSVAPEPAHPIAPREEFD